MSSVFEELKIHIDRFLSLDDKEKAEKLTACLINGHKFVEKSLFKCEEVETLLKVCGKCGVVSGWRAVKRGLK